MRSKLLFLLVLSSAAHAQYWGERVLEKSFEEVDFFFNPVYLNPYGIGGLGHATLGLIDDPLLTLHLNPARLSSRTLPRHHLYLNFRNEVEVRDQQPYYIHPAYDSRATDRAGIWFPYYRYVSNRKAVEPVLAFAYLLRPWQGRRHYTLGVTYQALLLDERYYEIPQNIYRSQLGMDYAGRAVADENAIPVVDKYSGEDEMHQQGHFLSLSNSLSLLPWLDLGLVVSRAEYDRDGSYGSSDLWENSWTYPSTSDRDYRKRRSQSYSHWDLQGGVYARLSDTGGVGMTLGVVNGAVNQHLTELDDSRYDYGVCGKDARWGVYDRLYSAGQSWRQDGRTLYGGIDLESRLSPSMTLTAYYRGVDLNVDLDLASALLDTSYSSYEDSWKDYYDNREYHYTSESDFGLHDARSGGGIRRADRHTTAAALHWQVDERTRVDIGLNWSQRNSTINSSEEVAAQRHNRYEWRNNEQEGRYDDQTVEDKTLKWHLTSRSTELQIPLIFRRQLNPSLELTFGLVRRMMRWRIEDVTEAWIWEKTEIINGEIHLKGPVIERYTEPRAIRSDIETMALAGLTIRPANALEVRLLAMPTYVSTYSGTELDQLQWWIDFTLRP